MLYTFAKNITYFLVRLLFKMRYEGLENIPENGGYILCSNHRSNWDPVFIIHKLPVKVHFMAKAELFKNKIFAWLISNMNAFPIERGKGDTSAMDKSVEILKQNGVLIIFPEGHRYPDGIPGRPKSGVAVLSKQGEVPVLCCSVDYGRKLGFRTPVTLRYHPLITQQQLAVSLDSPASIRGGAKIVMDVISGGLTICQKERALNAVEDSI